MYCSSTRKREWMIEKDGHCGLGEMVHEGLEVLKKGRYVDRFVQRQRNTQATKKGLGTSVKLFDTGYGNPAEIFK